MSNQFILGPYPPRPFQPVTHIKPPNFSPTHPFAISNSTRKIKTLEDVGAYEIFHSLLISCLIAAKPSYAVFLYIEYNYQTLASIIRDMDKICTYQKQKQKNKICTFRLRERERESTTMLQGNDEDANTRARRMVYCRV